jgi:hypothetical protein
MTSEVIRFELTLAGGDRVGTIELEIDQITKIEGYHDGRSLVSTGIGTFYVGQASRTAQARVHRYLADKLEHEAELEAVRADAAQEARIS